MFSGGNGFVCASVVCALFAAGYAFDFGGDPVLLHHYKLLRWSFISYRRVSLFAGIGIKHAIIDSMFVVIDSTSKCPTRLQEL